MDKTAIYKIKLNDKNIKVLPKEDYINNKTKILHECVCGNTWYTTPANVLKGQSCGCSRKKEDSNTYTKKLKDKNIKVYPLESYVKADKEILHKCICGNEWMVRPNVVLKGGNCGCGRKNRNNDNRIISHNKYLEKLKEKNIEVYPLENYVKTKIKILHKCTCGNEWMVRPFNVLQGNKCGTCYDYLKELKNKNIKIFPLEKYKNSQTKILHKCTCGNEWMVRPSSILNNGHCGCRIDEYNRSYFKDKPTILYYLKIGELYKIGITTKTIKERYQSEKIDYIILKERLFNNGIDAWDKELEIKRKFKHKLYLGEKIMLKTSNTEVFYEDINPKF